MVVLGWVGDQKWCNVTKTYAVCLLRESSHVHLDKLLANFRSVPVCGVAMFCIPLVTFSYVGLMVFCSLFGVTFASSFSFTPIITSRLVDIDDFTLAYGLILLVQGIGSLVSFLLDALVVDDIESISLQIGPPLAGFIFDLTDR